MNGTHFRVAGLLSLALTIACISANAADKPFDGVWKLNMAKSQLGGQTFTVVKLDSGKFRLDMQGFAYEFALGGKEFPTPDGSTVAVVESAPNTWDSTFRMNGKVLYTSRFAVDQNKATVKYKGAKADQSDLEQNVTLERVSGGPGVLGKWKSTEVKGTAPTIEIRTSGADAVSLKMPELDWVCQGKFDGKDHPVMMSGAKAKQTLAFERSGPKAFKVTTKLEGKPFYTEVLTVSDDGKTLTDEGGPVAVNEPIKAVYEKK